MAPAPLLACACALLAWHITFSRSFFYRLRHLNDISLTIAWQEGGVFGCLPHKGLGCARGYLGVTQVDIDEEALERVIALSRVRTKKEAGNLALRYYAERQERAARIGRHFDGPRG